MHVAGATVGRSGRGADVQTVFQAPRASLDPRWTIGRSVAEPLLARRPDLGRAARRGRVAEVLDPVRLPGRFAGRYPHELSTGQCQRAGLARALATGPRLLLLDEPLSALDLPVRARILDLLREIRADTATACLFVSHDIVVLAALCARIAVLHDGRIVEELPGADVFTAARHPHTRRLVADTPRVPGRGSNPRPGAGPSV